MSVPVDRDDTPLHLVALTTLLALHVVDPCVADHEEPPRWVYPESDGWFRALPPDMNDKDYEVCPGSPITGYCIRAEPEKWSFLKNVWRTSSEWSTDPEWSLPVEFADEQEGVVAHILSFLLEYRNPDTYVVFTLGAKQMTGGRYTGVDVRHGVYKVRGCTTTLDVAKRFEFWNAHDDEKMLETSSPPSRLSRPARRRLERRRFTTGMERRCIGLHPVCFDPARWEPVVLAPKKDEAGEYIPYWGQRRIVSDKRLRPQGVDIRDDTGYGRRGPESYLMLGFREKMSWLEAESEKRAAFMARYCGNGAIQPRKKTKRTWSDQPRINKLRRERMRAAYLRYLVDGSGSPSLVLEDTPPERFDEGWDDTDTEPGYAGSDDDSTAVGSVSEETVDEGGEEDESEDVEDDSDTEDESDVEDAVSIISISSDDDVSIISISSDSSEDTEC